MERLNFILFPSSFSISAPLTPRFRAPVQRPPEKANSYQTDRTACWKELDKGDYDWAHLAHTLWPTRVREKCKKDRSLAIAHGLEELCEVKAPEPKKKRAAKKAAKKKSKETGEEELL